MIFTYLLYLGAFIRLIFSGFKISFKKAIGRDRSYQMTNNYLNYKYKTIFIGLVANIIIILIIIYVLRLKTY